MGKLSGYLIGIGIIGLLIQIAGSGYGGLLMFVSAVWLAWETWKPRKTPSEVFDASKEEARGAVAPIPDRPRPAYKSPDLARKAAAFAAERKRVEQAVRERQAQASKDPTRR